MVVKINGHSGRAVPLSPLLLQKNRERMAKGSLRNLPVFERQDPLQACFDILPNSACSVLGWLVRVFGLAALLISTGPLPVLAQAPLFEPHVIPAPTPKILPLRYEEDYRYLQDTARRTDWLDPLKYIPLRGTGHPNWFITVGGEVRPFFERYQNEQWGSVPADNDGYWLLRTMLHTSVQLGQHVRLFAELKSGLVAGRSNPPRPVDVNELDLNQAFIDIGFWKQTGGTSNPPLVLRLGRQEIEFGAGRLLSVRELPNVRQSFDGGRFIVRVKRWQADAFALRPVQTNRDVFDDKAEPTQALWGLYVTRLLSADWHLDLYYIGNERKTAVFSQGRAAEIRHSSGGRLWYRTPALTSDVEFTYQLGKFGTGRVQAWALASSTTYTFTRVAWKPALGINMGANSGDRDLSNLDNQTFSPPAPRGAYFGAVGANGPPNILGFAPTLRLTPAPGLTVLGYCYFFWRQSRSDGVYNIPGFPIRAAGPSRARYIGTQPELDASWQINRYLSLTSAYAFFSAGQFIQDAQPSEDIHYLATWLTFKF
jgi:hypothetical protein